jgi:SAM-dependent methyltransferase
MFLYALTILVSAFLLFQVQPVIAKIILPWFGGSAAVWTTCMLFFQMVLLLGYLYSHALIRYLRPRVQMLVHCAVLLLSLAVLPIYPNLSWKPAGGEEPTLRILGLLAVTVGLPYFMLATTGPLIQAWYARRFKGAMPYRLYALSNVGSMGALLSYPFLFEPAFGTHFQAQMWSWAYVVFIVLCGITAFRSADGADVIADSPEAAGERPSARTYALWILLPATASVLLLAITNHLSANVAAIPFLWVLPLSIYLLTFILCFEGEGWYKRNPYLQLLAVGLGSMSFSMSIDATGNVPIKVMVPLLSIGLFTCCMVCHGELVRLKPSPRYLTHFYLMISAGGALGGLLVGLIAPHFFNAFYELPIGLGLCGVITLIALRANPDWAWLRSLLSPPRLIAAVILLGIAGFVWQAAVARVAPNWSPEDSVRTSVMVAGLAVLALIGSIALRGPGGSWMSGGSNWAAVVAEVVVLVLVGYLASEIRQTSNGYRVVVRNFYGGLRVRDNGTPDKLDSTRTLTHGTINHGEEFLNPVRRYLATTYYGPNTGVGIAIREKQRAGAVRIGVIGLGTGTVASYGRLGDYIRYYEINPLVLNIARNEFYFLSGCKAKLDVAMGDARLSLEREAPENFDVLAVDAFSSDSIPVHLLTREAMELYFRHLKPDGILAVHISNRYLDLQPVLQGEAAVTNKIARVVDTEDDETQDVFGATWVLVANPASGFTQEELSSSGPLESKKSVRLWTDDYSNLFNILK